MALFNCHVHRELKAMLRLDLGSAPEAHGTGQTIQDRQL